MTVFFFHRLFYLFGVVCTKMSGEMPGDGDGGVTPCKDCKKTIPHRDDKHYSGVPGIKQFPKQRQCPGCQTAEEEKEKEARQNRDKGCTNCQYCFSLGRLTCRERLENDFLVDDPCGTCFLMLFVALKRAEKENERLKAVNKELTTEVERLKAKEPS